MSSRSSRDINRGLLRASAQVLIAVAPAAGAGYAVGALLRYGLIEREDLGIICAVNSAPWWCSARLLVIQAFLHDVFGFGSIALAVAGLVRRSRRLALGAVAVGTLGMVLYGFTWSGVGALAGLLLAGRLQADRYDHGRAQRQHQEAPGR